jgi:hypothetical protein
VGEIEEAAGVYAEAKIQELAERKMRSDKPELARAMATALENEKPFRSELASKVDPGSHSLRSPSG